MVSYRYKYLYTKTSKKYTKQNLWLVILVVLLGVFLMYCNIRPQDTGIIGRNINYAMVKIFGITRFFIPFVLFYWLWYFFKSKHHRLKTDIGLTIVLIILFSGTVKVVLKVLKFQETTIDELSGFTGKTIFTIAENIFGTIFGSILLILLLLYVISVLFEISIIELVGLGYKRLVEDFKQWYFEITKTRKIENKQTQNISRYEKQRLTQEDQISPRKNIVFSPAGKNDVVKIEPQIQHQKSETQKVSIQSKETTKYEIEKSKKQTIPYKLPPVELLEKYSTQPTPEDEFEHNAKMLESVLREFDINGKVVNISSGPVVTMYELELEPGIKVQSVYAIKDNIALRMKTSSIHIVAPLPGKGTIGVEIPNKKSQIVPLRKVLESNEYKELSKEMKLPIVLGETIDGKIYVDDIVPMPHMLIAGATGSGKSVCIHSIIMSLLYKCSPDYLKLVLIDPKRLELMHYNGIPHLYNPNCEPENVKVITSAKDAAKVLTSLVKVMEHRYEKFAAACVRNIDGYNEQAKSRNEPPEFYIVVIIDEFADLILTVPREVEDAIQRLAQMARAVGIHLVLATQRPSVDVITGVIKANFSCRIAFQVLSKTDSRIILDTTGAEELLS
ncbi:MAG: DNA translocase FtsK, partial [Endomicrobia bacterium]|nr:DNA translocase FtsK [Endomicrobiia bacterium]